MLRHLWRQWGRRGGEGTGTLAMRTSVELQHNVDTTLTWRYWKCLRMKQRSLAVLSLGFNVLVACPFYLKRCACCARGPGYLRLGDWYSWDRRAWLVFWLGLLANLTVMGSVAPGGFWQFRPLMASSASTRRSKRMKPTPLETPAERVVGQSLSYLLTSSFDSRRTRFKTHLSWNHLNCLRGNFNTCHPLCQTHGPSQFSYLSLAHMIIFFPPSWIQIAVFHLDMRFTWSQVEQLQSWLVVVGYQVGWRLRLEEHRPVNRFRQHQHGELNSVYHFNFTSEATIMREQKWPNVHLS